MVRCGYLQKVRSTYEVPRRSKGSGGSSSDRSSSVEAAHSSRSNGKDQGVVEGGVWAQREVMC